HRVHSPLGKAAAAMHAPPSAAPSAPKLARRRHQPSAATAPSTPEATSPRPAVPKRMVADEPSAPAMSRGLAAQNRGVYQVADPNSHARSIQGNTVTTATARTI